MNNVNNMADASSRLEALKKDLTPIKPSNDIKNFFGRAIRQFTAGVEKLEHYFKTFSFDKGGEWKSKQERALDKFDFGRELGSLKTAHAQMRAAADKQGLKGTKEYKKLEEDAQGKFKVMSSICDLILKKEGKISKDQKENLEVVKHDLDEFINKFNEQGKAPSSRSAPKGAERTKGGGFDTSDTIAGLNKKYPPPRGHSGGEKGGRRTIAELAKSIDSSKIDSSKIDKKHTSTVGHSGGEPKPGIRRFKKEAGHSGGEPNSVPVGKERRTIAESAKPLDSSKIDKKHAGHSGSKPNSDRQDEMLRPTSIDSRLEVWARGGDPYSVPGDTKSMRKDKGTGSLLENSKNMKKKATGLSKTRKSTEIHAPVNVMAQRVKQKKGEIHTKFKESFERISEDKPKLEKNQAAFYAKLEEFAQFIGRINPESTLDHNKKEIESTADLNKCIDSLRNKGNAIIKELEVLGTQDKDFTDKVFDLFKYYIR